MPLGAIKLIMGKMSAMLEKKWATVFEDLKIFIIKRLTKISVCKFTI